jgi:hypothetical protein
LESAALSAPQYLGHDPPSQGFGVAGRVIRARAKL